MSGSNYSSNDYYCGVLSIPLGFQRLMQREEYLCKDLAIANAVVAHMCGYTKVLDKIKKKHSVHNKKRKCGNRVLIRVNANNYMHKQPT